MGGKSNSVGSAIAPVDEMLGTYLLTSGQIVRLYVDGILYAPDDALSETIGNFLPDPSRHARDYVIWHLTRRLGDNENQWPLMARFFLRQQRNDYVFSTQLDGTIVAVLA